MSTVTTIDDLARLSTVQFLSYLHRADVELWPEGERLRFSAPTGGLNPDLKAELARRKEEILAFLRSARVEATELPPVTPVERTGPLPTSFAQERLWFLDQYEPWSSAYTTSPAFRLSGRVEAPVLAASLREIVRRHEVLRTRFDVDSGLPVQVVEPEPVLPLLGIDLTGLSPEVRESHAWRLARMMADEPFDLGRLPLLRVALVTLGAEESLFLVTFHHIVYDGWSSAVFTRELLALYAAFGAGRPSPLPPLPIQYGDYAVWQRRRLTREGLGSGLEAELAYWRRQLKEAPTLELPTDRPRPVRPGMRAAHLPVALGRDLAATLLALGSREEATPYMVLLAVFQALLSRYSGQTDILTGSGVAGRTRAEIEGLIGFFVNTLVLRSDLSGGLGFRRLLTRVRKSAVDAFAHQEIPFERLVEELRPERHANRNPFFQAVFALQNRPAVAVEVPGLRLLPLERRSSAAKFDLILSLHEAEQGFGGSLEYATDLYDRSTVLRLVGHLTRLAQSIVEDPDRPLAELPWFTREERHQLVQEWKGGGETAPAVAVHELFAAAAARRPDAVALVSSALSAASLSYGELARSAGSRAAELRAWGVGPEVRVGLAVERSPDMVIALLAILLAGGAYVPLDPGNPPERLAFLLADSGVALLLGSERSLDAFDVRNSLPVVCLDHPPLVLPECPPASDAGGMDPDALAYILYTSGSTGTPKGVAVPHRAIARLVRGDCAVMDEGEVFLQLAPASFDAATFEIWGALANGGQLVIAPPGLLSPDELGELLARHGVTTIFLTAGLFHQVVEARPEAFAPLRQLLPGGDVTAVADVRRVLAGPGRMRVINGYGPTENTTFTTCHPMDDAAEVPSPVPLGRPIAGTQVYLLDTTSGTPPIGIPGELCTTGEGLARGYAGRPDLTAERFVPAPTELGEAPGARLYRTGDLARHLADGRLEFLGRIDRQVKIRGFRIEPAEVEAVLAEHPGVASSAVIVREREPGDRRLIACLVPTAGMAGTAAEALVAEVRAHVKRRLPDFMVPAGFVVLDALPLTASGKVDRRALAGLPEEQQQTTAGPDMELPQDPTEELLIRIWEEVLRRDRVRRDDDFFDLGGHSLLATQVVTRVFQAFAVELPIVALFAAPTLSGLAQKVREALRAAPGRELPPILKAPRDAALPLSFAQQRLWVLHRFEPQSTAYNMPTAVRLRGPLAAPVLARALDEVVRRHEVLRTTYESRAGRPVQIVAPTPPESCAVLPQVDLRLLAAARREAEARRIAAEEARCPFDLARGPVLRAALLSLDREESWGLFTLHHIAFDGWSSGVFLNELAALYGALSAGRRADLPKLPIQYADFACWQARWLDGEALETDLAFWRRQLAGAPPGLPLVPDRPRPAIQTSRGASTKVALPADLSADLSALARKRGVTLYMVLLAGFATLLGRSSGQSDIVVGSPIAGRNHPEIENLIGFFVNTLVLRLNLRASPSFADLLAQTRQVALDAYAHQDLPFERLVEDLSPERDLGRSPLFQVMLALQNARAGALELPGLTLEPLPLPSGAAMFDLTLSLSETGGRLAGGLEYNRDLFDPTTIARLLGRLATLLAAAVRQPEIRLDDLPLLEPAERHQVVVEWNATGTALPGGSLHERVEARAAVAPDALAVVAAVAAGAAGGTLSYGELLRRARGLARRLRAAGVGPEILVGLCAERSPEMVVGMLAVLLAGGAYLPLDPDYPRERLAFLLADARPPVVLVQEHLQGRLPEAPEAGAVRRIALGAAVREAGEETGELASLAVPANSAYAIYTSGSTGKPKGVINSHRGIVNRLLWIEQEYPLSPADRVLQKTPFSFDVSVWELFWPLVTGATLVLALPGGQRDSAYLVRTIVDQEITHVHFVPSLLQPFLDEPGLEECTALRRVLCSGEALLPETVRRFFLRFGAVSLLNLYGPTEAAVEVTAWRFSPPDAGRGVPIGRPIANTRIHLLDPAGEPVPLGVPGELHIGGVAVARGYLRRPELTAEKFVPDPFAAAEPGMRLYRTGDLARTLPGGEVEYLGRIDHQVKIRGFRVELGEIEAVLAAHEKVREAAVVVQKNSAEVLHLAAFFVAAEGMEAPTPAELRDWLGATLPAYMVPAVLVQLDLLPSTPSGKVDRRALAAMDVEWEREGTFVAPRNRVELALQQIWEEVLKVSPIGVDENFFRIGGNSLLAIYIVVSIRERLGRELPVPVLVQAPTIEGLATVLQEEPTPQLFPALVPLQTKGAKPPLFVVHGAGGNVFYFVELARLLAARDPERPFYGLQARGLLTGEEPLLSIEAMATTYQDAIRSVQPTGPYHLAGYSMGGLVAYELARRLAAEGEEIAFVGMFDAMANLRMQLSSMDRAEVIAYFAGELAIPLASEELRQLDSDAQLQHVLTRGWGLRRIPREFTATDAERYLRVMETTFEAARQFAPGAPLPGRVTVFGSAYMTALEGPELGWQATGGIEAHLVSGDHRTLFESPNVEALGELLDGCLARCWAERPAPRGAVGGRA